jgi:hypothetical protein
VTIAGIVGWIYGRVKSEAVKREGLVRVFSFALELWRVIIQGVRFGMFDRRETDNRELENQRKENPE